MDSYALCEAHVKDWTREYAHHTVLLREEDGVATFRVIWSRPTVAQPIPDTMAVVEVAVDARSSPARVSHALAGGFSSFERQLCAQERQLDWQMADKRAVRATLARLDAAGRLPAPPPYAAGARNVPLPTGRDARTPVSSAVLTESDAELEALLLQLFKDADVDANGSLDVAEFFALFETANLSLSRADAALILAQADVNGDGAVQYSEFAPVAVDVIQSLRLRTLAAEHATAAEASAASDAVVSLHGLARDELEAMMRAIFVAADANGDGMLSRDEFRSCLETVRLGPTRLSLREVRYFQATVTLDGGGRVLYKAFLPVVWDLLVETLKANLLAASHGELFEYLRDLCERADLDAAAAAAPDGADEPAADAADAGAGPHASGRLDRAELRRVLVGADRLRLTPVQVLVVLAEADDDDDGRVEYGAFLLRAVPLIQAMCSPVLAAQRSRAAEHAALSPAAVLGGLTREGLSAALRPVLHAHDGNADGALSLGELGKALRHADLALSGPQRMALLARGGADEADGAVAIDALVGAAYDVLLTLGREKALQREMEAMFAKPK
jgi:Ca2+-binding EF-hand superfamily protein